ncbi:integral membrane protein [Talaromyces stipitatus ATCC 10500]|uniref:Integral membrane protein n=1 Tax=Talaromyces stipitatus (strain ATCC 10500 / CBS 375.48 / QM 6759 / NRRL 1006) TaxID=441959 RepID=B8MCB5_TALSN|nr:uncharacterized protein TSTA_122900 [Talaromyces stipitatus ATCC 10500]EED18561.1 integral membrane protein [Talaromyces stipitatus ATCC 10500]
MAILSLKRALVSAILLISTSHRASAQDTFSFLPSAATSNFPACGLQCQLLLEAQSACVPPQARVSNTDTYVSCFCQSSLISGLPYTASMCPTCTSASDQQLLINWYKSYCAGGFRSTLTNTATATTSTVSRTTSTTSTTSTTTAPARKGTSSSSTGVSSDSKSWFSTHWQWVLMLIILVIGFSALAAGAVWLKKRLDAKQPGLYHGDDRRDGGASGGGGGPAAAFLPGSLRNLSRNNLNSNRASTTNNSSTSNVVAGSSRIPKQPSMSTMSFSNRRSLSNSISNQNTNNGHQMWGPNQARDFDNVAPVEEPVFRNSMASAAAAAAFRNGGAGSTTSEGAEGIGIATTTANNSRTDISSVGTGDGRATPRNLNRLSMQSASASNLHQQQQMLQQQQPLLHQQQSQRELQRPKSASPVSSIHD